MLHVPAVGIDLGTSTSSIAVLAEDGTPRLLADPNGDQIVPSVVRASPDGSLVVGSPARASAVAHSDRVAMETKRIMGTGETVRLGKKVLFPEEISAEILRHLKRTAEERLGCPVRDVVLSVPARFENAAREATRKAAEMAGLKAMRLINEPTAAALAYGLDRLSDRSKILVFDFGGGTLDVTILEMFEGILDVRTSVGDDRLGGKDVDEIVIGVLRDAFKEKHGRRLPPPSKDRKIAQMLKEEAERVKVALSSQESVPVRIDDLDDGAGIDLCFTREQLDSHLEEHLMRAMATVNEALARARVKWDDIDVLLPVGGTSRIPMFRRALEFAAGKPFLEGAVNPEEAVALGTAIAAGIELDLYRQQARDLMILDVSPHRLGVAAIKRVGDRQFVDDYFSELVPKDAKLPAVQQREYKTLSDGTGPIGIRIYEAVGESNLCREHRLISEMNLRALAPDARNEPVRVEFKYTLDGTLEVSAGYVIAPMVRVDGKFVLDGADDDAWKARPLAGAALPLVEQAERLERVRADMVGQVREAVDMVKLAVLREDEGELRARLDSLTDLLIELT